MNFFQQKKNFSLENLQKMYICKNARTPTINFFLKTVHMKTCRRCRFLTMPNSFNKLHKNTIYMKNLNFSQRATLTINMFLKTVHMKNCRRCRYLTTMNSYNEFHPIKKNKKKKKTTKKKKKKKKKNTFHLETCRRCTFVRTPELTQ